MLLCSSLPGWRSFAEMGLSSEQTSEGEGLPCPRCDSRETKFCYYNNYSTTQPRHFCRNCKRYWTAGGTLRNVPVGGGLRRNKKSKLSKHGMDLLSASTDGSHSSGNRNSMLLGSPSSSADEAADESMHAKSDASAIVPYRPTFEAEAVAGDHYHPFLSPSFEYTNVRNFARCKDALLAESTEQHAVALDANYGFRRPLLGFGCVDQAQSSSGEISSELSQGSKNTAVLPGMYPSYSAFYRPSGIEQQPIGTLSGFRENFSELAYASSKQGSLQRSVENHIVSHSGNNTRKRSLTEDGNEEVGNVINVRYPYDWEQVSEVLCGGTPDFFQMPTF